MNRGGMKIVLVRASDGDSASLVVLFLDNEVAECHINMLIPDEIPLIPRQESLIDCKKMAGCCVD